MTTVDQTYFLKPGETTQAYTARISAYNASKTSTGATTTPTDAMVIANQQKAQAQGVSIPGVGGSGTGFTSGSNYTAPGASDAYDPAKAAALFAKANSTYSNVDAKAYQDYVAPFNLDAKGNPQNPFGASTVQVASGGTPAAPATPATTTPAPAAPATAPAAASTASPVGNLKPGDTGGEVAALQQFLKSRGLLTDAQIATGPGIYGPATTAAVAALQHQLGIQAGADAGFYGPQTQAALSASTTGGDAAPGADAATQPAPAPAPPPAPGKTAVQTVIDDYTAAYSALGLTDIKQQYTDYVQKQTDLTNKVNDEKAAVDNNPWLSESVRARTKDQIDSKYKTQLDTLTHQVSLLDAMYKEGQLEVTNIVDKAEAITMEQQKEAADVAKQKQDAIDALAKRSPTDIYGSGSIGEYNFAKSQGYTGSFTQYQNEDANRKAKAAGSGSAPKTLEERKALSLSDLQNAIDQAPAHSGVTDDSGYITVASLKKMIKAAPSQGLTGNDVITQVGNMLAPNFDKKGKAVPNSVSDNYGLTASQKKLLGITP